MIVRGHVGLRQLAAMGACLACCGCTAITDDLRHGQRLPTPDLLAAAEDDGAGLADEASGPIYSDGERLDLARAISLALDNNRALQQRRMEQAQTRLGRVSAERDLFGPSLEAGWTWRDEEDNESGETQIAVPMTLWGTEITPAVSTTTNQASDPMEESSVSIAVSRPLLRLHADLAARLGLIRADHQAWQAMLRRLEAERNVRLETIRAWFAVVRVRARLAIRSARVADAEAFLAGVEGRVEAGFAAPIDAASASISLNQARSDQINEEASLRSAIERLNDQLGAPLEAQPEIPDDIDMGGLAEVASPEDDLALLLEQHEQVLAAKLRLNLAEQELRVAEDAALPDLDASLRLERRWSGDDFPADRDPDNRATFGLTLRLPLDGWRAERAEILQNQLSLRSLDLALATTRADLELRHRSILRDISRFEQTATLAAERLEVEESRLAANLERYEQGAVDNIEVTRSQRAVDQARVAVLEARIDTVLAHAAYQSLLPPRGSAPLEAALSQ